ncbi:MAG: CinA family protein [Cellvibrio sp.]|uniref:CinA family protein n=1 Tax=Cellvibrio sp. TaxID=1965322 RepID=UPI0031A740E4
MADFSSIIKFLSEREYKLVTAESCTAGMVTSLLATTPGCGAVLEIGYVVYSEKAKHYCLGVDLQTMDAFGLTSEEVAQEMALGALDRSGADFAIAVTGKAESNDELGGVICFAYALRMYHITKVFTQTKKFNGDRETVMRSAAEYAIVNIPNAHNQLLAQFLLCR